MLLRENVPSDCGPKPLKPFEPELKPGSGSSGSSGFGSWA